VKEIADREKIFDTEITRVLPLVFLASSIIEHISKRPPAGDVERQIPQENKSSSNRLE
jgi:hypothetical protein